MTSSEQELRARAGEAGFEVEPFEKALMLVRLLEAIRAHPFLGSRVALKGGTALNLFILDLPRLSVDIDLNYVGSTNRTEAVRDRPELHRALSQVGGRLGLTVKRAPDDHAGGKWRFSYTTALGRPGVLEVDVNFMLRSPLWSVVARDSHDLAGQRARGIPLLDDHELLAGKLAATVARRASRDLYDTRRMLRDHALHSDLLRLGFVVYGGVNRMDWRKADVDSIDADPKDVAARLVNTLRADERPAKAELASWTQQLVEETRDLMRAVLPLRDHEREFLDKLNDEGVIAPELLTSDRDIQQRIRQNPGLQWKALNVQRMRKGRSRGRGR